MQFLKVLSCKPLLLSQQVLGDKFVSSGFGNVLNSDSLLFKVMFLYI